MAEFDYVNSLIPGACFGTFKLPDELAFVVARGEGSTVWSTDGRVFLDYVLASGPMVLGHAHPKVVEAVRDQVSRGTSFYAMNEPAIELAAEVHRLIPCAEAVKFVGDGAEATFYCLRLARAFTGRDKVLKFEGAYHGHHDYALHGLKASGLPEYPGATPDSAGIPQAVTGTVLMAPFNNLGVTRQVVARHGSELAAIIVEPIQRALLPRPGFLDGLRELCDECGALLVFDEVVTGFRVALGGAQQLYNVTPDLCSLGKIVGGGLPLAVVAGRRDVVELSSPLASTGRAVYLSGTLNGNPLAAAAGLATLKVLTELDGPKWLEQIGTALADGLRDTAQRLSLPLQMMGPPAFPEPVFDTAEVSDYRTYSATNRRAAQQFGLELVRRGVFVHPAAKMYVSTAHTALQLDQTIEIAHDAMTAVRDQGLIQD
ncbi:aminotransferase class III-fold pyridoxal phosphate-dependent enzyme [Candidatus Aeolococcus gillhamiae]